MSAVVPRQTLRGTCCRSLTAASWRPLQTRAQALKLSSTASKRADDPEISFEGRRQGMEQMRLAKHARAVPVSPSYFARQPQVADIMMELIDLHRKYRGLPRASKDKQTKVAWLTLKNYRHSTGEQISQTDFDRCLKLAKSLQNITPELKNPTIDNAVKIFKRPFQPDQSAQEPKPVDRFGRAIGVGKRKTSVAQAWLVEGTGEVLINGKTLADTFGRIHDRESATFPLRSVQRMDKYNVWATSTGGGTTGQAEALAIAIAKALIIHEPRLKNPLYNAGCITRDPRMVERKKHGRVKARKRPAWVKR